MLDFSLAWPVAPLYAFNFMLIVARVGGLVGTAPLIGGRNVPNLMKVGLVLITSLILMVANWDRLAPAPQSWLELAGGIVHHLAIGVALGFAASLSFAGLQMGGQLIGLQVGFSLANTIDPTTEFQVALLDQVYAVIAGLVFLALDGHHWLMLALQRTFDLAPLAGGVQTLALQNLVNLTANVPALALQVAFPALGALIVADIVLGVLVRTIPQLNVFVIGMPLKVVIGLVAIGLTLSWSSAALRDSLTQSILLSQGLWR
jgi:flagellar biosynthesis protein FliR